MSMRTRYIYLAVGVFLLIGLIWIYFAYGGYYTTPEGAAQSFHHGEIIACIPIEDEAAVFLVNEHEISLALIKRESVLGMDGWIAKGGWNKELDKKQEQEIENRVPDKVFPFKEKTFYYIDKIGYKITASSSTQLPAIAYENEVHQKAFQCGEDYVLYYWIEN